MKVLFVTNGYPTAAHPEYCVFNKEQIDAVMASGIDGEVYFINGLENGKRAYLRAARALRGNLGDYDLIHCFHGLSYLLVATLRPKHPVVVSFLNSVENEFREQANWLARSLSMICKHKILTPRHGKIFKHQVPAWLAHDPLARCIPNGVCLERFQPMPRAQAKRRLGLDPDQRHVLFVSSKRLDRPQKRYDRFRETLRLVRQMEGCEDIRELLLVSEPRELIPVYMNAADLHLLVSDFEGSPNSVKEALACGTPVVATDVGNVRDMLSGMPQCHVATGSSADELAHLAVTALATGNRPDYRVLLRDKGLDIASSTAAVIRLYNDLLHPGMVDPNPA